MNLRTPVIVILSLATLSAVGFVAGRFVLADAKVERPSLQSDREVLADGRDGSNQPEHTKPAPRRPQRASATPLAGTTNPEAPEPIEPKTDDAAASDTSDSEAGAEPSATKEDVLANLDATFETETADKQWGAGATQAIYAIAQPGLGSNSEIRSVECRTSLCRIESVQEDSEHYSAFVSQVKQSNVSPEGFFTKTGETPDGKLILTMYLAREGHPLPHLE